MKLELIYSFNNETLTTASVSGCNSPQLHSILPIEVETQRSAPNKTHKINKSSLTGGDNHAKRLGKLFSESLSFS